VQKTRAPARAGKNTIHGMVSHRRLNGEMTLAPFDSGHEQKVLAQR
jgi:hypothetical protein